MTAPDDMDAALDALEASMVEWDAALAGDLAARRSIEAGMVDFDVLDRQVWPGRRPSRFPRRPIIRRLEWPKP